MADIPANKIKTESAAKPAKRESYLRGWFLRYYKQTTLSSCFLVLLAGYFFVVSPKITSINQTIGASLEIERRRQADLEDKIAYLIKLAGKRGQLTGDDIARVNDMLPAEPLLPELFSTIDWLGRDSGVKIGSISISQSALGGKKNDKALAVKEAGLPAGVKPIEVGLSVAAENYSQLKTFLANIERSSRIMDALALNYSPNAGAYTVTVRAYYQPDKTTETGETAADQ